MITDPTVRDGELVEEETEEAEEGRRSGAGAKLGSTAKVTERSFRICEGGTNWVAVSERKGE